MNKIAFNLYLFLVSSLYKEKVITKQSILKKIL